MSTNGMKRIYLFHKFERFHHWVQALLIISLLLTGALKYTVRIVCSASTRPTGCITSAPGAG